ncbi:unnamed protein product, partial [Ectocarpus sp. 8 AP-2014]
MSPSLWLFAYVNRRLRRMYLMDKFSVTPDPWDNRII